MDASGTGQKVRRSRITAEKNRAGGMWSWRGSDLFTVSRDEKNDFEQLEGKK
jgi:hypothetical protein